MQFPPLYKRTASGAIQRWQIFVGPTDTGLTEEACIVTRYGQVDGATQETSDLFKSGKNIGKRNETTPLQQAELEAHARWTRQKERKGYVEDIEQARAGKSEQGGIAPMLAQKFANRADEIIYPCYAQRKYDGIRCLAVVDHGEVSLWTRTRKRITSVPHIVEALSHLRERLVLDGELYNHTFRNNFEKIVSIVRKDEPDPDHMLVEYHVYDIFDPERPELPFRMRNFIREDAIDGLPIKEICCVPTLPVEDESVVMACFDSAREQGYEGVMIRSTDGPYEVGKRSKHLLKLKEFDDADFTILGIEEGRGKLAGHAAAFVCVVNGKEFRAKMRGELDRLRSFFVDHSLWQGQRLVVQFQGLTRDGIPRFPVGVRFRDSEAF